MNLYSFGQNKFSLFVDDEEDDSITKRYYELHDGHWAGIDFGLNLMLDKSLNRSFEGKNQFKNNIITSYNFRINFIDHKLVIKEDKLGFTIGLGYNHSSFDLIKNYTLKESIDSKTKEEIVTESFDSLNYTYNKIRASYLQIPLLFEYTPNKNSWFSTGVIVGYRFGSSIKNLFEYQKTEYITKTKGDFNLNTFQCDASVRFGYRSLGGFINYSLIPLFNTKMIAINPLSFGLTFNY
jgi:hypothetical protein